MNLLLASSAENGIIIPGDTNEVIWGTISFTIVVLLFLWKGLGPVKVMWHARIDRIRNEVTSAADTRAAAEAKLAEVESNIANAAWCIPSSDGSPLLKP
jgi:F0F1-type ATP synthase membrane subunit b/b'